MSKPAFTPGPWRPGKYKTTVVADTPVPEIRGSDDVEHYGGHLICESIAPQNVPVIAATPEMYEALKRIINELPTNRDWLDPDLEKMAKDALAKAEGREVR